MKQHSLYIVLFLLLLHSFCDANGKYSFSSIGMRNGLANNTVNAISQDDLGFIWVGSTGKIERYDGVQIRSYTHLLGESSDDILSVCHAGTAIWAGTSSGLLFTPNSYTPFSKVELNSDKVSVNVLVELTDSTIIAGTGEGAYIFYGEGEISKYIKLSGNANSVGNYVTGIVIENENFIWFSTLGGLAKYSIHDDEVYRYTFEKNPQSSFNEFTAISIIDSVIYLGTPNMGLVEFNRENETFSESRDIGGGIIKTMLNDEAGNLYIGTNGEGLKILNLESGSLNVLKHDLSNNNSLSSNSIYSLFLDKDKRLWVGTYNAGLNYLNNIGHLFSVYEMKHTNSVLPENVRSFYFDDNGDKYFGTREGLIIEEANGNASLVRSGDANCRLRSNIILTLFEYSGYILAGTFGGGITVVNKKTGLEQLLNNDELTFENVYAFDTDNQNRLWISTYKGIYCYDHQTGHIRHFDLTAQGLFSNEATHLFIDSSNRLWVSTRFGIGLFSLEEDRIEHVLLPSEFSRHIKFNATYEDSNSDFWIAGNDGLYHIEKSLVAYTKYSKTNGLSDNQINSVIESEEGMFWIGTNYGLNRFNVKSERIEQFVQKHGLPSMIFSVGAASQFSDSIIYMGTEKGLIYFKTGEIAPHKYSTPVVLTDLFIDGKNYNHSDELSLNQPLEYAQSLTLKNNFSSIGFRVVSVDYSGEGTKYFYKLEGVDNDWNENGTGNTTYFDRLKAGNYTLKIKANSTDNVNSTSINLQIKNPFYRHPIFYIIVFVVLTQIVFFLFHYIRQLQYLVNKMKNFKMRPNKPKVLKMPKEKGEELLVKITKFFEEEKPYMNAEIKVSDVAEKLDIPTHEISQVINRYMNKSFNDLVNGYRVAEVKKIMSDPEYSKYTLIALSENCGFNSKTSFYRVFKKETGQTPAEYLKSIKAKSAEYSEC
ncbi:MAG: helix-turn-helix domain-containing protein [Prolixibacteraceae bacterium]|nr:helix-turn-helix domain-containing protein [Prolixibacteraceae bacterium]